MLNEWKAGRLWYLDKPVSVMGLSHIQRMVVVRLSNGSLIIHNPVELSTTLQKELALLGPVCSVVCASPVYHTFLSDWWLTYSKALFYATPTTIQMRSDLNFDGALSNQSPVLWKGELYQTALLGIDRPRKMAFCDPKSRTLLLSDNLIGVQKEMPLWQQFWGVANGAGKGLKLPWQDRRKLNNMPALRSSVQEIMTWPFDSLISANGLTIENGAKNQFYQAFWWAF